MDKIRLGVIGTGSVVREIYQYLYFHSQYADLFSVQAAADPNDEALHTFCDKYGLSTERRFSSYAQMVEQVPLDAVQVNTPDSLHEEPVVFALARGLDVLVPKPLADKIGSAHRMIEAMKASERLLGVDFHKRDDPRIKECQARYASGVYGQFQLAQWYMIDRLMVADPNHQPRFFASAEFAEKNSPISFLTVHMADALIRIVNLRPTKVRAHGWKQKLPHLAPIAVDGYDLCDTEIVFENGGVAHIVTGWHLPNTAPSMTVQSARIIGTDGYVDLALDAPGYREVTGEAVIERNPLFRTFASDGTVTGYGMDRPGQLYQKFIAHRNGQLPDNELAALNSLFELGFWTTVVCQAAEESLAHGRQTDGGGVHGIDIDVATLLADQLGTAVKAYR